MYSCMRETEHKCILEDCQHELITDSFDDNWMNDHQKSWCAGNTNTCSCLHSLVVKPPAVLP